MSHANPVIGLRGSVEFDANETGSPAWGTAGNQANDAAGGLSAIGEETVSVAAVLATALAMFWNTARYS
jgi:hypothetical protein